METVKRMMAPGAVGGCVAAFTVALTVRDPHEAGSWGLCPFLALTGWQCPACGGLRAVHDLAHGDVLGALSSNLYFVLIFPAAAALWGIWMRNAWQGRTVHLSPHTTRAVVYPVLAASLGLLALFTVLRNTPGGAWLAP